MDREYRGYYDNGGAEKYRNAPICLQLIGRRLQEEKLLAMTERLQSLLVEARTRIK